MSAGPKEGDSSDADWAGGHERKYVLGLAATPAERLAWLEQAILFAHRCGALPRAYPAETED